jgi:hypothetical protein
LGILLLTLVAIPVVDFLITLAVLPLGILVLRADQRHGRGPR